jgi:hypothetical protein
MTRLLAAGFPATNDPGSIDAYEIVALAADGFESGDTAGWSMTQP